MQWFGRTGRKSERPALIARNFELDSFKSVPYHDLMTIDLFAGMPVRDYGLAAAWYERLLGAPPSFVPNDAEAVWELADHQYVFIEVRPEHAGHAMHTVFVGDFDDRISQIAERGLEPAQRETYANGVRKATFRDPDGNEIGFGGAPA